jgi:hypothetical protein
MSAAIIIGGSGVFGALTARELAAAGIAVTIAGRDRRAAERTARLLGEGHRGLAASLDDLRGCRAALHGQTVAVNCVGSLVDLGPALLEACLEAGCHYVDNAVERSHAALIRGWSERFRRRGLTAAYGCSSFPALSGALALAAHAGQAAPPRRARVTLFIGNANPKGRAAIRSFLEVLGRPIRAPQALIWGFHEREVVPLPPPFGRRAVFNFDSPDYDLLRELLGVPAVWVKVGFELRLVTYGFALLARLGLRPGARAAGLLEWLSRPLSDLGSSGGVVLAELFYEDGSVRRRGLLARRDGQRMAALPCALVARELCRGAAHPAGSLTAFEFFGFERLLQLMTREGFEIHQADT